MNRNFKVVFSKARGALMVVNEATASVQAKGTKTVIAAAIAAVAGVASAAATPTVFDDVTLDTGDTLTVTAKDTGTVNTVTAGEIKGNVTVENKKTEKTFATGDSVTSILLKGGELVVSGVTNTATVAADETASGTVTVSATQKDGTGTSASQTLGGGTYDALNLNLNVFTAAADHTAGNATVSSTGTLTLKSGKLTTATIEGSDATAKAVNGSASLTASAGDITLGVATQYQPNGEVDQENQGSAYDVVNAKNVALTIGATTGKVEYVKGSVTNDGTLTISGKTAASLGDQVSVTNAGTMTVTAAKTTIGEKTDIKNTGTLSVAGTTKLDFNAGYTAEAGSLLELTGAAVNVAGDLTADSIKLGEKATGSVKETNQVVVNGSSSATLSGKVTVGTLAVENSTTTVKTLAAKATTVAAGKVGALTVADPNAAEHVYADVSLGEVTLGADKTSGATFTLTNNGKSAVAVDTLTVAKSTAEKVADNKLSSFTLAAGNLVIGKLANEGTVALSSEDSKVTVSGENKGTLTNAGTLTVAGTFTNSGTVGTAVAADDDLTGTIVVSKDAEFVNSGLVYTKALTVDGTVKTGMFVPKSEKDTTLVNHLKFAELTLNDGGKFVVTAIPEALTQDKTFGFTDGKINLAGGQFYLGDAQVGADYSVTVGAAANVNVTGGEYAFKKITNNGSVTQTGGTLTLETLELGSATAEAALTGGTTTITNLDLSKAGAGKVTVGEKGSLTVDGKLTTTPNTAALVVNGDLNTNLTALGYELKADGTVAALTKDGKDISTLKNGSVTLNAGGTFALADLGSKSISTTGIATIKGFLAADAKGLVDLGEVTISDLKIENNTIGWDKISSLAGVTTSTLSNVKVTGFGDTVTQDMAFGAIKQTDSTTDDKTLTITGATLTLSGTDELVSYDYKTTGSTTPKLSTIAFGDAAATLVTQGEGAKLGVVGSDNTTGNLVVESGSLTVDGVKVKELDVKGALTANGAVDVGSLNVAAEKTLTLGVKDETGYALTADKAVIAGTVEASKSAVEFKNAATVTDATAKDAFANVDQVTGTLNAKTLTLAGDLLVAGTVDAASLNANGKVVYVGNSAAAGTLLVDDLQSGHVFADPAWKDGVAAGTSKVAVLKAAASSTVEAGRSSLVSLGTSDTTAAETLFAKTGFTLGKTDEEKDQFSIDTRTVNSVVYAEGAQYAGNVIAGAATKPTTGSSNSSNVSIAANSMLLIDAQKVDATGEKSVFVKDVTLADHSVLYVDNVKNGNVISLSASHLDDQGADVFFEGDMLMDASVSKKNDVETGYAFTMRDKDEVIDEYGDLAGLDAAYGMFEEGKNVGNTSSSALFNRALYTQLKTQANSKAELAAIANDVAALGATTGVQTLTLDAVNQMADTVAARTSVLTQRGQGVNVWVDVNGGSYEAKTLFDGAGYQSDVYAGTLGVDYQFTNGAVLGAALTVGTADTDSKNSGVSASTDSDLVGFSVYGSKTFDGIWNVAGDIGYLQASNDVTANGYQNAWKFSQDTDAWTVGVRGEVLTKAGPVTLVPHIGLRYTSISTDGFEAGYVTDIDDQNVFQLPVGVTVAADFQTNGWTVAPKFDLSVVPTFGDKDAELKLGITGVTASDDLSVRVIDSNPVQATLGVNATNGAWGFGLNYKLGVGSDDRMNNTFNANVRYAF